MQPVFESMVVFAWCVVSAIVPNSVAPEPPREQLVEKAADRVFREMASGVALRDSERYLSQFSPELRKQHEAAVKSVLDSPKRHCLVMRYKLEPVSVGSYTATYKAKILTEAICPTSGYQSNIEYATVTIAPAGSSDSDGKFIADGPSAKDTPERWEINGWETEKVVPCDKSKDR